MLESALKHFVNYKSELELGLKRSSSDLRDLVKKLIYKQDVDIFSNGLYRFKKYILDTLKSKKEWYFLFNYTLPFI
jgi:hypothetical protein